MKILHTTSNRASKTDSLASITGRDIRYRHKVIVRGLVNVEAVLMAVIRERGWGSGSQEACIYLLLDDTPQDFSNFCRGRKQ